MKIRRGKLYCYFILDFNSKLLKQQADTVEIITYVVKLE